MMPFSSAERFWAAVTFGSTFSHSLLDDVLSRLLILERLVGLPHVLEEHERAEAAQHHHADLERIALPQPLFEDFLVEKVEVECHARSSSSDIQTQRRRRR